MGQDLVSNFVNKSATIANGASLSDAVDTTGLVLIGLKLPAFTAAAGGLTFQVSVDGGVTFSELVDEDNVSIVWLVGNTAGDLVALAGSPSPMIAGVTHIKVRSGTAGAPVNQAAARTITLIFGVPNP